MKTDLQEIERITNAYAATRASLDLAVKQLNAEIEAAKRRRLPRIKALVAKAVETKEVLMAGIKENPDLFKTPKTRIFSNIRVGFQKQKGELSWANEGRVLFLIKTHFEEMKDALIKTTEKPIKSALQNLTVADLKKLGVELKNDKDVPIIKPMDSEIEKLVDALLKSAEETGKEAA